MLTYANRLKPLILPQYGRNIQNMVDRCLAIEDADERRRCAEAIIDTMLTLFPAQGDRDEYLRKLWDHLQVMAEFRLNLDLPYGAMDTTEFEQAPDPVAMPAPAKLQYPHYGSYIALTIDIASGMEPGPERDRLVLLTANHMKKLMMAAYKEGVDDERIFADLRKMSHGAINLDPATTTLQDYKTAPTPSGRKKKKK